MKGFALPPLKNLLSIHNIVYGKKKKFARVNELQRKDGMFNPQCPQPIASHSVALLCTATSTAIPTVTSYCYCNLILLLLLLYLLLPPTATATVTSYCYCYCYLILLLLYLLLPNTAAATTTAIPTVTSYC